MNSPAPIPFSILDLCPVTQGGSLEQTFRNTLDLAQHAERWGYQRYWLAEHHNMTGIASAATAVVIGHVAAGTKTIRVGSGGIMLPNHSPLVIAEQFGTLDALFPGRIDLGLGRAPGTDQRTARALRRDAVNSADSFPQDVMELQALFRPAIVGQAIQAVPGAGRNVPIWLLGSSLFSAQLAGLLGLPYVFASHFAPHDLSQALQLYRSEFKPSAQLEQPYCAAGVNVFAADTDAEAARLFTSLQQAFVNLRRGMPGKLNAPLNTTAEKTFSGGELALLENALHESLIGSPDTVRAGLESFIERTGVDELFITAQIYDHSARLRSFEIVAQVRDQLAGHLVSG